MKKEKILIFTGSFGNGHISASNALAEIFTKEGKIVEIYDIAKISYGGKIGSIFFKYLSPFFLKKLFEISNTPNPSFFGIWCGNVFFKNTLQKILTKSLPNTIWCTFPLLTPQIQQLFLGEVYIQITDYFSPHLSWSWGNPTKIFCLDDESKKNLLKNNSALLEENIIVQPFPLSKKIKNIATFSIEQKKQIQKNLQKNFFLSLDFSTQKIFLLFFHHILFGNEKIILEKVMKNPHYKNHHICILAGNNFKKFRKYTSEKISVLPWIEDIENFYAVADIVGGKCGGAFISEVIFLQLPLFVTGIFSCQELENYKYLKKYYKDSLFFV